jgi:hypothetical protein
MKKLQWLLGNRDVAAGVYLAVALLAVVQALLTTKAGAEITNYNNYIIFENAFVHLVNNQSMYAAYPDEYWDLYKYSPTFALLMAPFHHFPTAIGLALWNVLNVALVIWGMRKLHFFTQPQQAGILWFSLVEMITSLQNEQSNGLVAGFIIAALGLLEQRKFIWAALLIVLCAYVKVLGLAAVLLFVLFDQKWRSALWIGVWTVVLSALPLLVCSADSLAMQYTAWFELLKMDHLDPNAYSWMNIWQKWFGIHLSNTVWQLIGAVVVSIPALFLWKKRTAALRVKYLAVLLMWVVLFNHKAESPTFVIAVLGAAIWLAAVRHSMNQKLFYALALFVFVFTVLNSTDLFPASLRRGFFAAYYVKAIPIAVVWVWATLDLYRKVTNMSSLTGLG